MSNDSPDQPKRNWPLILTGVAAALLLAGIVLGLVAMYVADFNLLEWTE
ncbi:MAG TPA: hypothetical protein VLT83_05315 [Opitutaceae bacterium]|nr:hypothetical protein [Opitutaceae bacterium]